MQQVRKALTYWMQTFGDRKQKEKTSTEEGEQP
jgi:hypothetical protein